MIDVQAELYTIGRAAVLEISPNAMVSSTAELRPTHLPFVTIIEADNSVFKRMSDSLYMENYAEIMIEVNVWTDGDNKLTKCREIMNGIDTAYGKIGLMRMTLTPVTNYNEPSIYRMVARYRGVVSKNKTIYRR